MHAVDNRHISTLNILFIMHPNASQMHSGYWTLESCLCQCRCYQEYSFCLVIGRKTLRLAFSASHICIWNRWWHTVSCWANEEYNDRICVAAASEMRDTLHIGHIVSSRNATHVEMKSIHFFHISEKIIIFNIFISVYFAGRREQ